jgi:RimJ/RimL family protein N-acetyltransferase
MAEQRRYIPENEIVLREVEDRDLDVFFEHQSDPQAYHMAAFTAKDPTDKEVFIQHWKRILEDEQILIRSVLYQGQTAGHVLSFEQFGEREVSYWLGRQFWGKNIATRALVEFLKLINERPLYARAAKDNTGSIRVLEKCGFRITGEDLGFSNARGTDVEEYVLTLES